MTQLSDLIDEVRTARQLPPPATARMIRRAAKVSQSRMAEALGVDRTTLARWEAGTSHPRPAQRIRYASLLAELQRELAA